MATNFVREGKSMYLTTASGAVAGDAFVVGDYLPCVLLTNADAGDGNKATVATEGVFKLSVNGSGGGGNAIAAGDMLYWENKNTPLSKNGEHKAFGVALETSTHASNSILVMLTPKASVPDSVDTDDLEDNAVVASKIAANAVITAKIHNANVTYAKLHADVTKHFNHALTGAHDAKMEPATSGFYMLATADGEGAFTMGDPAFAGQKVSVTLDDKDTDNLVITFDSDINDGGDDIITMDTEGESAVLVGVTVGDGLEWRIVASHGTLALSST